MAKTTEAEVNLLEFECAGYKKGYSHICGIDEAGRGPLAGAVFAAAVIFPEGLVIEGINDSKKLSEKKREELFDVIKENALTYCIAQASHSEIDEINILRATFLAMQRAVDGLSIKPDLVLVDGNCDPKLGIETELLIKGDARSQSIAAASILAKVARDREMLKLHEQYPEYQFDKHKGYGTKKHYEAIEKHGVSDIHRQTFLKKILGK